MTALTKPIQPDRSKIDMHNSRQVRAWAKKLNISPVQLQKVVETVGNSAAEVRKEIDRSGC
jgi:3-oxoacyl-[acyl-carrier-protein] synthase III